MQQITNGILLLFLGKFANFLASFALKLKAEKAFLWYSFVGFWTATDELDFPSKCGISIWNFTNGGTGKWDFSIGASEIELQFKF